MVAHNALTGTDLHEPKGVASASSGQVYVANGSGSGSWAELPAANVGIVDSHGHFTATNVEGALDELFEQHNFLTGVLTDISTASFVLVPITVNCTIASIKFVQGSATTTSDDTITVSRGGDSASLGTQVIAYTGSGEGVSYTFTPSGNSSLTASTHKYLKIATNGASNSASPLYFTIEMVRT